VEALVCATPEEIVAYMMHFDSKIYQVGDSLGGRAMGYFGGEESAPHGRAF
jgi:predicted alpha/beta-fold hydrolase